VNPPRRTRSAAAFAFGACMTVAAFATSAARAEAPFRARCEAMAADARVDLDAGSAGYRIDNSLSFRTLTRMKRPQVQRGYVLGLTHTESRVSVQVAGKLLQDAASGNECIAPRVRVAMRYLPIVVYVGSEFAPGTCAYREILAHEMRHLNSYLAYLPKVEERVRARFVERFAGKPLYARRGEAAAGLQREIDARWLPTVKAEMSQAEKLQAEIDSPQEYARLSKVCQGAVQSFIGSTRT
jgi:hypothetical protein